MAVDLVQQQPSAMNNLYKPHLSSQPQRQTSPGSSGVSTPTNLSPTSPRTPSGNVTSPPATTTSPYLPYQSRQLRPPKCPLYVPAVLRPTERPAHLANNGRTSSKDSAAGLKGQVSAFAQAEARGGPLTPPPSAGNSYDDGVYATDEQEVRDAYASQPSTPALGSDTARKALGDDIATTRITRLVTDEWNEDAVEDVTGVPTRDHWKPDSSALTCDYPSCQIVFSLLHRRHHCRRCGQIFCASHSAFMVPLDQHARFHRQGYSARACGVCAKDYKAWEKMMGKDKPESVRKGGSGSSSGSTTPVTIRAPSSGRLPGTGQGIAAGADEPVTPPSSASVAATKQAKPKNRVEVLVGSITRDWNWSTF